MARRTKRTIRRQPPLTRELLKLANELDRLSRTANRLALKVADAEYDAMTLGDLNQREEVTA